MEDTIIDGVSDNTQLINIGDDILEAMLSLGNGEGVFYPNM